MRRRDLFKMFPAVAAVAAVPATSLVLNAGTKLDVKLVGDVPKPLAPPPQPRQEDRFQKLRPKGEVAYTGFNWQDDYSYGGFTLRWTGWKLCWHNTVPVGQWVAYQMDKPLGKVGICSSFPGGIGWFNGGDQFDISFHVGQMEAINSLKDNKGKLFLAGFAHEYDIDVPLRLLAFERILDFIDAEKAKDNQTITSYGPRAISGTA